MSVAVNTTVHDTEASPAQNLVKEKSKKTKNPNDVAASIAAKSVKGVNKSVRRYLRKTYGIKSAVDFAYRLITVPYSEVELTVKTYLLDALTLHRPITKSKLTDKNIVYLADTIYMNYINKTFPTLYEKLVPTNPVKKAKKEKTVLEQVMTGKSTKSKDSSKTKKETKKTESKKDKPAKKKT